jgi:hypothetical protein
MGVYVKLKTIKMEDTIIKCDCCESEINTDMDFFREGETQTLCEECEREEWDGAMHINIFGHSKFEEGQTFYYSKEFGFANEYFEEVYGDDEQSMPISGIEYVRIDGWRGYNNPIIRKEWITFDGWSTGYADGSLQHKNILHDLLYDLAEEHHTLYCPIWVVTGRTSNVFSTATDIMVKKSDLQRFEDFLFDSYGVTLDMLKESLK